MRPSTPPGSLGRSRRRVHFNDNPIHVSTTLGTSRLRVARNGYNNNPDDDDGASVMSLFQSPQPSPDGSVANELPAIEPAEAEQETTSEPIDSMTEQTPE